MRSGDTSMDILRLYIQNLNGEAISTRVIAYPKFDTKPFETAPDQDVRFVEETQKKYAEAIKGQRVKVFTIKEDSTEYLA